MVYRTNLSITTNLANPDNARNLQNKNRPNWTRKIPGTVKQIVLPLKQESQTPKSGSPEDARNSQSNLTEDCRKPFCRTEHKLGRKSPRTVKHIVLPLKQ